MDVWLVGLMGMALGALVGAAGMWGWSRGQVATLQRERDTEVERRRWVEEAHKNLETTFRALASETLQANSEEFLKRVRDQLATHMAQLEGGWKAQKLEFQGLAEPIGKSLETLDKQVRDLEQRREGAYQGLQTQLQQLGQTHQQLQRETVNLAQALKSPTVRGRWGEVQLRRVVELAGMVEHVDFDVQQAAGDGRPDMVVHLPHGATLALDAKASMQAFLEAMNPDLQDDGLRREALKKHAADLGQRVTELGQRRYWEQFKQTPEFVVMFVPNEASMVAAFEHDPRLFESAAERRVLLTTPVTLLALLKTVAYGWQQYQSAENARRIADEGKELFARLSTFAEHLAGIGKELDSAVNAYNRALGSWEGRLVPSARKLKELGTSAKDLPEVTPVERTARAMRVVDGVEGTR